jgi:hypothetical protein
MELVSLIYSLSSLVELVSQAFSKWYHEEGGLKAKVPELWH